jgi:predicted HTH transcriptional regulator
LKQRPWTFLTYHGRVLVYLTKNPHATCREIAQKAGVTERAIQKVICDLVGDGYIVRHRTGRGNTYKINPELPMRHRMEREHAVGDLLKALG